MAGGTGRHGRPDEPDDAVAAGGETSVSPVTQPLPMVRREGPESQHIRAVAKRVPSALPALGRDEASDAPPSARSTADRRRRAREAASDEPFSDEPSSDAEPSASAPSVASAPIVPRPRPQPEIERAPEASTSGEVELVPLGSRRREIARAALDSAPEPPRPQPTPEPVPQTEPGPRTAPARAAEPAPGTEAARGAEPAPRTEPARAAEPGAPGGHKTPYGSGGPTEPPPAPPVPPVMGQPLPARPRDSEVIDAQIVEDGSPRPYAAPDAQTDEWVTVGSPAAPAAPAGPVGTPRSQEPRAPRHLVPESAPLAPDPPSQPPPRALPGPDAPRPDTWETTPLPPVGEDYQGRRRARRRPGRLSLPGWLVVLGVLIALSAAIAVPFLVSNPDSDEETAASPTGGRSSGGSPELSTSIGPGGAPVIVAPSATPGGSDAPSAATAPTDEGTAPATSSSATTTTSTAAAPPPPPPPFSLTVEAESGARSGCAQIRTVGGANVVDRLGDDWQGCFGRGVVTFDNVNLPAGTFTITVYYVFGQADSDRSRYARLRLDPTGSGNTIDLTHTYGRATSVQSWTAEGFTLGTPATFAMSFTNPDTPGGGQDRAPALDRIVIQQTS